MGIWRLTALMGWRCFLLIHRFLDGSVWRLIIALYDGFWYPSLFVGWFSLHFFRGFSFFNCLWVAFEKRWYSFMYFFIFILLLSLHFFTPFTLIFFYPRFTVAWRDYFFFIFFPRFILFIFFFLLEWKRNGWKEGTDGLDFAGFFSFPLFFTSYLCAGHSELVLFLFLSCVFLTFLFLLFNNFLGPTFYLTC